MNQNAAALAELAAMKARGQLNDEEFEAAKATILNEGGKALCRSTTSPQEKFVCTEATADRGPGLAAAIGVYLVGMIMMLTTMSYARGVLSITIGGGATIYSLYLFFFGVKDTQRTGPCPHCGSTVTLQNKEETVRACRACKHRIVLRGGKLFDVTPTA